MKHEKTCALCVYFISTSSCMPFPLRSHSSLYSSFSKHRLSLRKKNEEIFFKYVLRVGTILSPLSLLELKDDESDLEVSFRCFAGHATEKSKK